MLCRTVTAILLTLSILYYALVGNASTTVLAQVFMILGAIATASVVIWARMKYRKRNNIEGSDGYDLCVGIFCTCCASLQVINTVRDGIYEGFWDGYAKLRTSEPVSTVTEDVGTDVESGASDNSATSGGGSSSESSTASAFSFRSLTM